MRERGNRLGPSWEGFGVPLGTALGLRADREWKHIDLVVHDEDDSPVVAIEMKVDSHERRVEGVPQTIAYPKLLPEGTPFLFITLGDGEYYHAPHGQQVKWILFGRFHEVLEGISTNDPFVERWRETIANEVDLRKRCFSTDFSRIEKYRGKTWNLYLLGHLKEKLTESLSDRDIGIDPFVYTHGPGADTILYFGRSRLPAYPEINQNGRLNLKVYLEDLDMKEQPKRDRAQKAQDYYQHLLGDHSPKPNQSILKANAKSKTIMPFHVGIERRNEKLSLGAEEAETIDRLSEILEKLYAAATFVDVDIAPAVDPPWF
jgi:hypothetical protein